jgi:hypothetical protein
MGFFLDEEAGGEGGRFGRMYSREGEKGSELPLRGCEEIHQGRAKLPLSEQSSHPNQGLRLGRSLALPR